MALRGRLGGMGTGEFDRKFKDKAPARAMCHCPPRPRRHLGLPNDASEKFSGIGDGDFEPVGREVTQNDR
jgi:hypothetical protein